MKQVLITFHTKTNTTKEVADFLAEELSLQDMKVDIAPFTESYNLSAYDLVIIGAPINGMQMVPEFSAFLKSHEDELLQTKVAFYNVSYMLRAGRKMWQKAILKSFSKLNTPVEPIATGFFGGKIDKPMPGAARLIFGLKKDTPLNQWDEKAMFNFVFDIAEEMNGVLKEA